LCTNSAKVVFLAFPFNYILDHCKRQRHIYRLLDHRQKGVSA
jgi:hypothetical protein